MCGNQWSREYATGIVMIFLVALIWAASSVLIQYLYNSSDNDFHSPFLVTYLGVSLFTLWIPTQKTIAYCSLPDAEPLTVVDARSTRRVTATLSATEGMEHHACTSNVVYEGIANSLSPSEDILDDEDIPDDNGNVPSAIDDDDDEGPLDVSPWGERDHIRVASYIAPVWFVANWTYNASLAYTSVSSSTVLASTGSLFTFLFAVATADESFSTTKLFGVILGVTGSILTARSDTTESSPSQGPSNISNEHDSASTQQHRLLGDILGLISAVGYGAYAVQTRVLCPSDEALYSMQTLLGYIGLLNMVALSPIAFYLLLSGGAHLTWFVVGFLVVKGLLDNVLSDYLWLRAVMLTNATTATVGLGLTIPLAFASDFILKNTDNNPSQANRLLQVLGALAVLMGFVLVNIGNSSGTGTMSDTNTSNDLDLSENAALCDPNESTMIPMDESQSSQEGLVLSNRNGVV